MWLSAFAHLFPLSALLPSPLPPSTLLSLVCSFFVPEVAVLLCSPGQPQMRDGSVEPPGAGLSVYHLTSNVSLFNTQITVSHPVFRRKLMGKGSKRKSSAFRLLQIFVSHENIKVTHNWVFPPQWQPQQLFTRCHFCWGFVFPL